MRSGQADLVGDESGQKFRSDAAGMDAESDERGGGVECGVEELRTVLNEGFWGSSGVFLNWLAIRLNTGRPAFERVAIQKDMDELKEFLEQDRPDRKTGQMGLL